MKDEQLVKAWVAGRSAGSIADEYGVTANAVYLRIKRLRDAGLKVDLRAPGRKRPNVDALNALVEEAV